MNTPKISRIRQLIAPALVAVAFLAMALGVLAGCGGDSNGATGDSATRNAAGEGVAVSPARLKVDGAWMTQLASATDGNGTPVGDVAQIGQVLMPGSHDAGTWDSIGWLDKACADSDALVDFGNFAGVDSPAWNTVTKWAYAQYDEPYYQAQGGARYFDLRAIRDKSPGDSGYFLRTCHSTIGADLGSFFNPDYPGSIVAYANEHPQEVLVVDWQKVIDEQSGSPLSTDGLTQFRDYIMSDVCPNRALTNGDVYDGTANPSLKREADIPKLTLSNITSTGHNIINLMASGADTAMYKSLPDNEKSSWCIWDRGVVLQSYWDTDSAANPWKNGFAYASARTALFADQAAWLAADTTRSVPPITEGKFHVNQNIWNIDPGSDIANLTFRKGLDDWTETELRPYQKPDFIVKYVGGSGSANVNRRNRANILMVDFMATEASGTAWEQLSSPWIKLNCEKFNVPKANCPFN